MDEDNTPEAEVEFEVEAEVIEVVAEPEPEVEVEVVAEPEPEPEVLAEPEVEEDPVKNPEESFEVSVKVSALTFSPRRRNSESVAMLQRRLSDLGYAAARSDLRGWFHENTRKALEEWQADNGAEVTGICDLDEMRYLFDGAEVTVIP